MTTLRTLYDLRKAPASFDFATFLAGADCARQLLKHDGLDLTICTAGYRQLSERDVETSEAEKSWRVQNILVQVAALLPSIRVLRVTDEPQDARGYDYPMPGKVPYLQTAVERLRARGANPRAFRAPAFSEYFLAGRQGHVVLMPRVSKHFPQRNAVVEDWLRFAGWLGTKGYKPVVIPDVENLDQFALLNQYITPLSSAAAVNQSLRLALCEAALTTVCGATGSTTTLVYSDTPYLIFDLMRGGVFTANHWRGMYGIEAGAPCWPWAVPGQVLAWKDSTFENLVVEFERYEATDLVSAA